MISVNAVRATYGVAFGYVLLDCFDKVNKSLKREPTQIDKSVKTGIDCLVWQTSASVAIPGKLATLILISLLLSLNYIFNIGYTINRVCALSSYLLKKSGVNSLVRANKVLTTAIGLASIPLIIHPIDHMCHFVMDKSVRPLLNIDPHLKTENQE